jgi:hypothetical protein
MRQNDVTQFLVKDGVTRHGQPWSEFEVNWVCAQFRDKKKSIVELAMLNGRSKFANACVLHKHGFINVQDRNQYRAA